MLLRRLLSAPQGKDLSTKIHFLKGARTSHCGLESCSSRLSIPVNRVCANVKPSDNGQRMGSLNMQGTFLFPFMCTRQKGTVIERNRDTLVGLAFLDAPVSSLVEPYS